MISEEEFKAEMERIAARRKQLLEKHAKINRAERRWNIVWIVLLTVPPLVLLLCLMGFS